MRTSRINFLPLSFRLCLSSSLCIYSSNRASWDNFPSICPLFKVWLPSWLCSPHPWILFCRKSFKMAPVNIKPGHWGKGFHIKWSSFWVRQGPPKCHLRNRQSFFWQELYITQVKISISIVVSFQGLFILNFEILPLFVNSKWDLVDLIAPC